MVYAYQLHGLQMASAFPFPELQLSEGNRPDLRVAEGQAPLDPLHLQPLSEGCIFDFMHFRTYAQGTQLQISEVGNIWIGVSGDIFLERLPGVTLEEARMYVLGSALAIFLLRRGAFPMHGNTVALGGRSLMFIGSSGAGKSTLCTYWMDRGYSLVADDVSLVQFRENGRPYVSPGLGYVKLWGDSLRALNRDPETLPELFAGLDKRRLSVTQQALAPESGLAAIIELWPEAVSSPSLELLSGAERFSAIAGNIYRGETIPWLGQLANHFTFCSRLAAAVPVYRLTRPADAFALEAIYDLVEESLFTSQF